MIRGTGLTSSSCGDPTKISIVPLHTQLTGPKSYVGHFISSDNLGLLPSVNGRLAVQEDDGECSITVTYDGEYRKGETRTFPLKIGMEVAHGKFPDGQMFVVEYERPRRKVIIGTYYFFNGTSLVDSGTFTLLCMTKSFL
jgi:hypothetical protein